MNKHAAGRSSEARKDLAETYNEFKLFEGRRYTGMKIGRSHRWNYDAGEWKEKKVAPDKWEFSYAVAKRRAAKAPEGSGVPVGTEYHWYILAHQNVRKLNANDYTTSLSGLKFKVAHKRAGGDKWSATSKTQRKRMIQFLRQMIEELGTEPAIPEGVTAIQPAPARKKRATTPPSMLKKTRRR